MAGWIVVNHFYHSAKFAELHEWLLRAADQAGLKAQFVTNAQVQAQLERERPDWVVLWDKDVAVGRWLEARGVRCFNSAAAIEACDDKFRTYTCLLEAGIAQPDTMVVPLRFQPVAWQEQPFVDEAIEHFGLPVVVKESFGSFGAQVHLARTREDLVTWLGQLGARDGIVQEFVTESAGRDYRLQVIGDEVVATIERTAQPGEFRANLTHGGQARQVQATLEQERLAIAATRAVGAGFAGVDLLDGPDGPVVCEVNSNAHFVNMSRTTGIDIGRLIMEYVRDA
ncbi:RimK family alpha-L-glutamate ligase [Corynebacterium pilosum]|uniref:Ribosomal protein S6 modification protein n=1 Tax=Corynebacterium pilosum TaxID=35756 RepID=A0A376CKB5_9CORY|nr:RimK family alpha-L-glutamate ligase [Corynebacterium pilosum]STC68637.1 ribosomal protein S6 modification protein [Corynebacterium pilosum]